jgi:hypothetical protein
MHTDVSYTAHCNGDVSSKQSKSRVGVKFNYKLIQSVLERGDICGTVNGRYTGWTTEGTSNPGRANTFVSIAMHPGALWAPASLKSKV